MLSLQFEKVVVRKGLIVWIVEASINTFFNLFGFDADHLHDFVGTLLNVQSLGKAKLPEIKGVGPPIT